MPSLTAAQCKDIWKTGYERMLEAGYCCDGDDLVAVWLAYRIDYIAIRTFGPLSHQSCDVTSFYEFTDSFTGVVTNVYSLTTEGI